MHGNRWFLLPLSLVLAAGPALAQPVPPPINPPPPGAASVATTDIQPGDRFGFRNVDDIAAFVPALAPHGRWVASRWGMAFVPNAPAGWQPYVNGGWGPDRFWRSEDPWGWATDHYGRWGFDDAIGWVWVPGGEWAPSWAAWREDDEVVGWAPIPPSVRFAFDTGFGNDWRWNDWNSWYAPSWVWVPRGQAYAVGFRGRALPWDRGARYWRSSRWQWGFGFGSGFGGTNVWVGIGSGWSRGGWNRGGWNNWGWGNPAWGWNGHGWNQPWGWNNRGWNNWGRNNGGWNNRGGNDWNRGRDWDRRGRDPQRGAPGSVGDAIGRDLTGQPPQTRPPGNFARDSRPERGDFGRGDFGRSNGGRGDQGRGRDGNPGNANPDNDRRGRGDNSGMNGGMNDGSMGARIAAGMGAPPPQPRAMPAPPREMAAPPPPREMAAPRPAPAYEERHPRNNDRQDAHPH